MPRFLIDHGTATVSAALVDRIDGRWRLLGAAAFPAGVGLEAVLAYVAEGVSRALAEVADDRSAAPIAAAAAGSEWSGYERIVARSLSPRRIAVLAPNVRRAEESASAAEQAGWRVAALVSNERDGALAAAAALADPTIEGVLIGGADPSRPDEREHLATLAAHAAAVLARRPDLVTVLAGGAADHRDRFPIDRLVLAAAPTAPERAGSGNALARILTTLGGQLEGARILAARSVAALAEIAGGPVELVEVGASGGSWFRAMPGAPLEGFLVPGAALVPDAGEGEEVLDEVLAWSPLRLDRPTHRDRLRDLGTHPWWDAAGEGTLLRMAALRAALSRVEDERQRLGGTPPERMPPAEVLLLSGGVFALAPGPALALAAVDTLRRPGLGRIAYDHARLLGPLGALDEDERREMLSDLADDLLMPIGSVLVVAGGRPGREMGSLTVSSEWATSEVQPLSGGALRLIELPPGAPATIEVQLRDGSIGAGRARTTTFEASGGLGGLLVDTRGVPMRLPHAGERRREVLAQWQRSLWPGIE